MATSARALGLTLGLTLGLACLSGCSLWMREPEFYATQVSELLEGSNEAVEACYDRYLSETDPKAAGELSLQLDVLAGTGAVSAIEITSSTVPEALAACVTDEIAKLKLDPVDTKTARGTFSWTFELGPRKRPPADPFAGAQAAVLACYSGHLASVDREATGELVVDYAFAQDTGKVERLEVVAEATTAPAPVVECASAALRAALVSPDALESRNLEGRRSFAFRYDPFVPGT